MAIERDSHISMYKQIANVLEEAIYSGQLKPNQKLPTEVELMDQFNVSRVTARTALQSLFEKGLVIRKQGKGTFVNDAPIHHELDSFEGFYGSFTSKNMNAVLMDMKLDDTPEDVRKILGQDFNRSFWIRRHYMRDDDMIGFGNGYYPKELAQYVTWSQAEQNSMYTLLTKYLPFELKHTTLSIRAFPSTEEQAKLLGIEPHDPVLLLSRTIITTDNNPISHLRFILRADTNEFNITLPNPFSLFNGIQKTK